MTADYLLYANLILLSRLIYLRYDAGLTLAGNLWLAGVQATLVIACFSLNAAVAGIILVVVFSGLLSVFMETRLDLRNGFRLLTLALLLLLPAYLDGVSGMETRNWLTGVAGHVVRAFLPEGVALPDPRPGLGLAFGLLILANEVNILVRAVFHHCRLEPREPAEGRAADRDGKGTIDRQEYNAGRVIGFLERWLMFLVVTQTDDFSALAFILAAKGLARMKQLEDKQFAEYMLIGTLLSALAAIAIGFLLK